MAKIVRAELVVVDDVGLLPVGADAAEGLYRINKALGGGNVFWDSMNYENVGGTPVLGVNAPVIIGHGCSSPKAIRSMILSTEQVIKAGLTAKLQRVFQNQ